jgi:hypothetical protein
MRSRFVVAGRHVLRILRYYLLALSFMGGLWSDGGEAIGCWSGGVSSWVNFEGKAVDVNINEAR